MYTHSNLDESGGKINLPLSKQLNSSNYRHFEQDSSVVVHRPSPISTLFPQHARSPRLVNNDNMRWNNVYSPTDIALICEEIDFCQNDRRTHQLLVPITAEFRKHADKPWQDPLPTCPVFSKHALSSLQLSLSTNPEFEAQT